VIGEPPVAEPETANHDIEIEVLPWLRIYKFVGAFGAIAATTLNNGDGLLSPTSFLAYMIKS
jgi:hypothetical protein